MNVVLVMKEKDANRILRLEGLLDEYSYYEEYPDLSNLPEYISEENIGAVAIYSSSEYSVVRGIIETLDVDKILLHKDFRGYKPPKNSSTYLFQESHPITADKLNRNLSKF